ncbi:MAG: chloride channel protein [Candidatus Hydrogenedentes bacterium]|nr:chloride channel protein [Candidatus Hydrogenedentota bacterium]
MSIGRAVLGTFKARVRSSQFMGPILLAVSIGAGAGLAAVAFRELVHGIEHLLFEQAGGWVKLGIGAAYTIPIVAFGGLLVGLITRFFAPETKGHGVPEVMLAVAYQGGRIRARVTLFKALAAALCIGSGGAAGREGPIVQIGSALGSTIGQFFRLPDRRVILSVACGAAGGIAATFNAPMAGVIFALEVILGRFTSMAFGLVVLSSATATVVSRAIIGDHPAFMIHSEHGLASGWEIVLYAGLGVMAALVAQLYTRTLYGIEEATDRVRIPEYLKPAIGGALVGLVGIWVPQVFGLGYDVIEKVIDGSTTHFAFGALVVFCLAKILCTSLSIGSGGSGGIFAPALFIGAMFGGAYGCAVNYLFPEHAGAPGAYALVGMAAVFAGAAHAPITAILILFEMTDNYRIILPLMSATVISTFVSQRISSESIYTIKLRRRGIRITAAQDVNLMDAITVRDAMTTDFSSVSPEMPVPELMAKLASESLSGYPVVDESGRLAGVVAMQDVEDALIDRNPDKLTVADICTKNVVVCRPDQSLSSALAQFGARNIGRLPVIDPEDPRRVVGMLRRSGIIAAYANAHNQSADLIHRVDAMRALNERSETVLEKHAVRAGSPLAGTRVRDAGFPEGSTLTAVVRGDRTIVPRGSTLIEPGDLLMVLATRQNAGAVHKWLKQQC